MRIKLIFLCLIMALFFTSTLSAQNTGQWSAALGSAYSMPVGSLSEWFKPAPNYIVSVGQQYDEKWFIGGVFEFSQFDEENLSGYPAGKLALSLEHYGLLIDARYTITKTSFLKPYLKFSGGLYSWKGVRGEVQADSTVTPFVPEINERKQEETNWGFRVGAGTEIILNNFLVLDVSAYYRFVLGDLFPTMQPLIELEGVSGFQSLNLAAGVRFYF
ncbi:outer membrane beta-barrel protein [candidate division KSB1 bacterium]|nr:outer membrane beta-barrel protein [candidate division KSB1 bacterium]